HKYDIAQGPIKIQSALVIDGHYLIIDLIRIQVTHPLKSGRSTKFTIQATSYLTGYTGGGPCLGGDQDRFHDQVVVQADRILYRPIAAPLHLVYLNMVDHKIIGQHLPGLHGNIGHGIKGMGRFLPKPFIDLIAPKRLIALRSKELAELLLGKGPYVSFIICYFHRPKIIHSIKNPVNADISPILTGSYIYPDTYMINMASP